MIQIFYCSKGFCVEDPQDIIKTPGTESNVKEIYDTCNELKKNPINDIINQFSEYNSSMNQINFYSKSKIMLIITFNKKQFF